MRPVKRSKRHEQLVRDLAESVHPTASRPIFPTMRELLCFAAVLGFDLDKKKPLDSETMEIDGRTFENHEASGDIILLVSLAHTQNAEILKDENEDNRLTLFEEYAEGGLQEIQSWLKAHPQDAVGDNAIISALSATGRLGNPRDIDDAIHDVRF